MKILFTALFIFSSFFLNAQTVATMKVEKPKKDTIPNATSLLTDYGPSDFGLSTVFSVVEQMPEYPGGDDALIEHMRKNTNQQLAKERNIYGVSYVGFIVDTAGQVTDIKTMRGLDSILDKEALRVVSILTKFKPGMQNKKVVPVQFTVPVRFTR